jgi:hypothetical protein
MAPRRPAAAPAGQLALGGGAVAAHVPVAPSAPLVALPARELLQDAQQLPVAREGLTRTLADLSPAAADDGPSRVTGAEHALTMQAFALRILRATPAELDTIDAAHRAAGYGGPVDDDGGALGACAPGPEAPGPRVTCACGSEMLERQFDEHARRFEAAAGSLSQWTLHATRLAERGLPAGTAPTVVSTAPGLPETPEWRAWMARHETNEGPAALRTPGALIDHTENDR